MRAGVASKVFWASASWRSWRRNAATVSHSSTTSKANRTADSSAVGLLQSLETEALPKDLPHPS